MEHRPELQDADTEQEEGTLTSRAHRPRKPSVLPVSTVEGSSASREGSLVSRGRRPGKQPILPASTEPMDTEKDPELIECKRLLKRQRGSQKEETMNSETDKELFIVDSPSPRKRDVTQAATRSGSPPKHVRAVATRVVAYPELNNAETEQIEGSTISRGRRHRKPSIFPSSTVEGSSILREGSLVSRGRRPGKQPILPTSTAMITATEQEAGPSNPRAPRRAHVLLAATGTVAAMQFKVLVRRLSRWSEVKLIAAHEFLFWVNPAKLAANIEVFADEFDLSRQVERGSGVLNAELRKWADIFIMAPLSANSLAKIAGGLSDCLTMSIVRAWRFNKPVFIAPAMTARMWNSRITVNHIAAATALGIRVIHSKEGAMEPSRVIASVRLFFLSRPDLICPPRMSK